MARCPLRLVGLALCAGLLVPAAAVADSTDPGAVPNLVGGSSATWQGNSPMVAGESAVSHGEFVYQDYLYDDAGAAVGDASAVRTDASWRVSTNQPGMGTYQYPSDAARYGANAADISQFRAVRDGDRVRFMVVLNTLLVPDTTVVGIALGDATSTARHAWPMGAGISTAGTQHVITAWGGGAMFDDQPIEAVGGEVAQSVDDNTIQVSLPLALVGSKFRVYVASGLWDSDHHGWMQVGATRSATTPSGGDGQHPNIFNVAFRQDEATKLGSNNNFFSSNWWWERSQAEALAKGDIDKYFADVDLDAPDTGPQEYTGYHQRIYYSPERIAAPYEGIDEATVKTWTPNPGVAWHSDFIGPWQTYGVYVPERYKRMTVLLHGSGLSLFGAGDVGVDRDLGDSDGAVLVDPLARGVSSGFADYSEMATLEAMDDAQRHYVVDPSLTTLGGVSMGAIGAYRILELHPDLFGGAVMWSGCSGIAEGYCTAVSMAPGDEFENFRNVQVFIHHGVADYLLTVNAAAQDSAQLTALGYPYRLALFPLAEHTSFYWWQSMPWERDFIRELSVDTNPVHVTYKTSEGWWRPDISQRLVYDHAYWVSGLRTRDKTAGEHSYGTVDAITQGLGRADYTTSPMTPDAGTGSQYKPKSCVFVGSGGTPVCMTYAYGGMKKVPGGTAPRRNTFSATLTNLSAAAFDTRRMGLDLATPLVATLQTDGAGDVTLLGVGAVHVAGADASQHGDDVVVHLPQAGTYTVTLAAAA